jgi:hypothetical protein
MPKYIPDLRDQTAAVVKENQITNVGKDLEKSDSPIWPVPWNTKEAMLPCSDYTHKFQHFIQLHSKFH